jgi:hypothetical protein
LGNVIGTSFATAGFSYDANISPNNQSFSGAVTAVVTRNPPLSGTSFVNITVTGTATINDLQVGTATISTESVGTATITNLYGSTATFAQLISTSTGITPLQITSIATGTQPGLLINVPTFAEVSGTIAIGITVFSTGTSVFGMRILNTSTIASAFAGISMQSGTGGVLNNTDFEIYTQVGTAVLYNGGPGPLDFYADSGNLFLQVGVGGSIIANFGGETAFSSQSGSFPALQIADCGLFMCAGLTGGLIYNTGNVYYNGTNYVYMSTNAATIFLNGAGEIAWYLAPSGTAGNTATLTESFLHNGAGVFFFIGCATGSTGTEAILNSASSPTDQLIRDTSSMRYKTNIVTLQNADIEKLLHMRPVSFTSTQGPDNPLTEFIGFIAEEMDLIEPRLTTYIPTQYETVWRPRRASLPRVQPVPNSPLVPDSVQYRKIVPVVVGAIQLLTQRICALEQQLAGTATAVPLSICGAHGLTGTATFTGTVIMASAFTVTPAPPYMGTATATGAVIP